MKMPSLLSRNSSTLPGVIGSARVDRDAARAARRAGRGDVVILSQPDLDGKTCEALIRAQVAAVVNTGSSISGRYPSMGPLHLVQAGVVLIDGAGEAILDDVKDGAKVRVHEGEVFLGQRIVGQGIELAEPEILELLSEAKRSLAAHLDEFSVNMTDFLHEEGQLVIEGAGIPGLDLDLRDRQVVVVDANPGFEKDLRRVRPFLKEYQPILIGVNGGADALFRSGAKPDLIIGDPDTMSAETLKCGAMIVLPAEADGHAKGLDRVQDLGVGALTFPSSANPADLALLLAYHRGASLIATVGVKGSLEDFLDRDNAMEAPSTFLTRVRVGDRLVDGRALATLYRSRVSATAIALFVLALMAAAIVVLLIVNGVEDPVGWGVERWNTFALWVQDQVQNLRQ
ncbi:thiamine pyrophosphokinase [Hoyosella sp. G463]|uniref:Thiamine pyrophosphokinase n=1 Tax=Lolliginicoccus lacisalsi TaxID=2742202 RepID=A0A927JAG5_9ACTN|nr:putative cytokinetic ring protein SteA [Lolliginicoccus lacisalsi]MBD8505543.1 thiamine pyrophosphokinase [Lolliginicoccus lacisalsi]